MKSINTTEGKTPHFYRFATPFLLFVLFSLSGNVFAQNESDSLAAPTFAMDPASGELLPVSPSSTYDTIPRFTNHIIHLGFGFAFPLRDFHASDPTNEIAGYAAPGYSLSTGVFVGFAKGSEAGWYFGAAYSGFRKSSVFVDSLNSAIAAYQPDEAGGGEPPEALLVDPGYRPRYDVFSLSTGFAFDGSDERVSAYGSLLINFNYSRMNRFDVLNNEAAEMEIQFRTPSVMSTGFSAAFGLRFQQQFSVGIAFHYIGAPTLEINEWGTNDIREINFDDICTDRRIHFLEVKMGYAFVNRGNPRPPKVEYVYY